MLTGAGCSTESGIPDYRGQGRTEPRSPIQHDAYLRRAEVRQRYWARATVGWVRFSGARPNPAHGALAALEEAGALAGIITQNVDRLHHAAGSRRVVELHGALAEVACLACGDRAAPRVAGSDSAERDTTPGAAAPLLDAAFADSVDRIAAERELLETRGRHTYLPSLLTDRGGINHRWREREGERLRVWVQDMDPGRAALARRIIADAFTDWTESGIPLAFTIVPDSIRAEVIPDAVVAQILRERLGMELAPAQQGGYAVRSVRRDGGAARIGIQPGDLILGINGRPLQGAEDLRRSALDLSGRSRAVVVVQRGAGRYHVTIPLA